LLCVQKLAQAAVNAYRSAGIRTLGFYPVLSIPVLITRATSLVATGLALPQPRRFRSPRSSCGFRF
jgi:hypothetical protein